MELSHGKTFEQPDAGAFVGTIIDVVEMPNQQTQNGPTDKVRILWVLAKLDGSPALDSEGNPLTVAFIKPAKWHEKSHLYQMAAMILNSAPPLISQVSELEPLLLGRSNMLFLTKSLPTAPGQKAYTNVTGVTPLPPGVTPPQAPAGFVRSKFRTKTQTNPQNQQVQTFATQQAAQQAQQQPSQAQQQTQTPTVNFNAPATKAF